MARDNSSLKTYRKRRDFKKSPEPKGTVHTKKSKNIFVIQKHKAQQLHFDLRLEIDGVLKSWAVPKGPSLNSKNKRLAVLTDDHPLEYARFEGVIPKGLYGAGAVMVWDIGTYRTMKKKDGKKVSMKKSFKEGRIEVFLDGSRVSGGYALVRTGKSSDNKWLLIKMRDEHAHARKNPVNTQKTSILTGRTMRQIAQDVKKEGASNE